MPADVSGLRKLAADLRRADYRGELGGVVRKVADNMAASARRRAPIETGSLRASIRAEHPGDLTSTVIADDEASFYVEFGTSRKGPRPFMTPSGNEAGRALDRALIRAISKSVL